jgi:hypothetical protein
MYGHKNQASLFLEFLSKQLEAGLSPIEQHFLWNGLPIFTELISVVGPVIECSVTSDPIMWAESLAC